MNLLKLNRKISGLAAIAGFGILFLSDALIRSSHASPPYRGVSFFMDRSPSDVEADRYYGSIPLLHGDGSYAGSITRSTLDGFDISYSGYLTALNSPVWVWVRLNGRGNGSDFKAIRMERQSSEYYSAEVYRNQQEFSDLFFYAYHGEKINNWDIEVYFVNERNQRDENYGSNFKGTLTPQD